jgi:hypothetical protein
MLSQADSDKNLIWDLEDGTIPGQVLSVQSYALPYSLQD